MILDKIVELKQQEVALRKTQRPLDSFINELQVSDRDFKQIRLNRGLGLIAEFKRKSPSENKIRENDDLEKIIQTYEENNFVSAISILTDEPFFGGKPEDLTAARKITTKPLLRKDFIIDAYQVYEARLFGADAILLIARILTAGQLAEFIDIAAKYNMDCLVEIHAEDEIEKIPESAKIIGVNNRNLDTLEISLDMTLNLAGKLRNRDAILISESGIHTYRDVWKVRESVDAMLIGSSILKADNAERKITHLFRPRIKICGITNTEDGMTAAAAGADFLGFIFYEKSPRYVQPEIVADILKEIKIEFPGLQTVGVFVNETQDKVLEMKTRCQLDYVQLYRKTPDDYSEIDDSAVIDAFRFKEVEELIKLSLSKAKYSLVDAYNDRLYGGTGEQFDWGRLGSVRKDNVFLAGGINPINCTLAAQYQPFALDLSSGVEASPGKKDHQKIKKLFGAFL